MVVVVSSIAIALGIVAILGIIFYLVCYRKARPNEALIVYGVKPTVAEGQTLPFRIILGGGIFVLPIISKEKRVPMDLMELSFSVKGSLTKSGVPVSIHGTSQVKIRSNELSVARASQMILGKSEGERNKILLRILEGHIRSVLGGIEPEYLFLHLEDFATKIEETTRADFDKLGFEIVSISCDGLSDDVGYLETMGKTRLAEAKKVAVEGESAAKIKRLEMEKTLAEATKDYEVKASQLAQLINESKAQAELAYDLAKYKQQQKIITEQMRVKILEKESEVEIEKLEAMRKSEEMEASIKKQADAEKYRIEQIALAKEAEALSDSKAQSLKIREVGRAESEAITLRGKAEASAMSEKSAAWKEYNEAAILEMLVDKMPAIMRELASPLSKTEKIIVHSGSGEKGISKVTEDMTEIVSQVPSLLKALSGLDMKAIMERYSKH